MSHERIIRVRITGKVQGVWFRAWTREEARDLGLDGWVRNRLDGSVEAVLAGESADIDTMLRLLESGPPMARVGKVAYETITEAVVPGFVQRSTA